MNGIQQNGVEPNTILTANNYLKSTKTSGIVIKQEEEQMAEIDTTMLSGQHADIRREAAISAGEIRYDVAQGTNEAVKESIKGDWANSDATRDARYDVADRISSSTAQMDDRFFTVARDTADLRAQVVQAIDTVKLATELNALKSIVEGQRNTTYLSDKIGDDGEKTRVLINDLKYHDLNRALVERNSELVEEREGRRHWRYAADQGQFAGQFAALQSQIQAFQSQLQDTRQGMVNLGTMTGVGQTATPTNIR